MAEKLTEIELDGIHLHETKPRSLARDASLNITEEDDIETALGTLHIIVQGDRNKPAILTYHDIGLNSTTCFQGFFNYPDMVQIMKSFCVYHVNAPGQHEGSLNLPLGMEDDPTRKEGSGYNYPTMDQLSNMIVPVLQHYSIKTFIGFGVGAGANVLARFGVSHPQNIDALVLINCTASKSGWTEWGYQKFNSWYLKGGNMTHSAVEYLLWHWFGSKTLNNNHDLVNVYSSYIKSINPANLAMFIESYIKRTDIGIVREMNPMKKRQATMIRCPVMLVSGDYSPHLDDTVAMNSRLDPASTDWMKFPCGGMVLEEDPGRMVEAFRLFLQGMGYVPSLSSTKLIASRVSQQFSRHSEMFKM